MVEPLADSGQALVVRANLKAQRALAGARQHLLQVKDRRPQAVRHRVALEPAIRADAEVKPGQAGQRQHGRVQLRPFGQPLQAGDHVATEVRKAEGGIPREQLGFAPGAAGGHRRAGRQPRHGQPGREPAAGGLAGRPFGRLPVGFGGAQVIGIAVEQHIARIRALANGAQAKPRRQFRGQVFQAVHRQVGAMLEQGHFKLLGKESLGQGFAGLRQGSRRELVARGLDELQLETQLRKGGAALVQHPAGLGQRQGAAAGGQDDGAGDGHGGSEGGETAKAPRAPPPTMPGRRAAGPIRPPPPKRSVFPRPRPRCQPFHQGHKTLSRPGPVTHAQTPPAPRRATFRPPRLPAAPAPFRG